MLAVQVNSRTTDESSVNNLLYFCIVNANTTVYVQPMLQT
jgi:hypothetical protein